MSDSCFLDAPLLLWVLWGILGGTGCFVKAWRWITYGILLLGVLSVFGWLSWEQGQADKILNSELSYPIPLSEPFPAGIANNPERQLELFAAHFTNRYRQADVPLRVRALKDKEGKPYLRLGVAVIVPRRCTARTARTLWHEARSAPGPRGAHSHLRDLYLRSIALDWGMRSSRRQP